MHGKNLKNADLNLLVVFEAIARSGSVTAAAESLSLSQPAVSHALNRLRRLVEDRLFLRGGDGLVLTPRAKAMIGDVQAILSAVDRVLTREVFDPAKTEQTFRLVGSDYASMTLVPRIAEVLRRTAPLARLEVSNVNRDTPAHLAKGEIDLAFYGLLPPPGPFGMRQLFMERFVGLVCEHHPLARKAGNGKVTFEDYLAFPHIVVTLPNAAPSPIDSELNELGRKRNVVMATPSFGGNIAVAHNTDLIVSAPSRLASLPLCRGLVPFELPFQVAEYPYIVVWREHFDEDPVLSWLCELVVEAASNGMTGGGDHT